jgi:hypothetical protein
VYRKNFSCVLFPGTNGKVIQCDVEEFDAAVATGGEDLVLVGLSPCGIEEGVLGIETDSNVSIVTPANRHERRMSEMRVPFLCNYALRCEA